MSSEELDLLLVPNHLRPTTLPPQVFSLTFSSSSPFIFQLVFESYPCNRQRQASWRWYWWRVPPCRHCCRPTVVTDWLHRHTRCWQAVACWTRRRVQTCWCRSWPTVFTSQLHSYPRSWSSYPSSRLSFLFALFSLFSLSLPPLFSLPFALLSQGFHDCRQKWPLVQEVPLRTTSATQQRKSNSKFIYFLLCQIMYCNIIERQMFKM